MMADGSTLEDIRQSFVFFKNHIDAVERGLEEVLQGFASQLNERPFGPNQRKVLKVELETLYKRAEALVRDLARLGSVVTARPHSDVQSYQVSAPVLRTG